MTVVRSSGSGGGEARATVLLVEDNDLLREALSDAIQAFGYRVFAAANGQEALELEEGLEVEIDLVVSDLMMPGMNALELYETLKGRSYGGKILVITGYAMPHAGQTLAEQPGVAWANKPVSIEKLKMLLAQLLG